jgi:hypothetical protein
MSGEMQVYEEQPLTAAQIRIQVDLIQSVMREVMKNGEHYGVIPGCGKKPSLLKPGAEKIMFTFRLVADPEVEVVDLYHPTIVGHREYRVKVRISARNGTYLGAGVGSCCTLENKYRFKGGEKEGTGRPVPTEYWNLRKAGKMDDAQALLGGPGFAPGKLDGKWEVCSIGEKVEHDNPADYYNTCEKMAKKRALVDATLTVTAASDIFTQDLEDLQENGVLKTSGSAPEEQRKMPEQAPDAPPAGEKKGPKDPAAPISEPQVKAIHAILNKIGVQGDKERHDKVASILKLDGLSSINALTKGQASTVIDALSAEANKK